jgi:hypothetical protein
MGISARAWTAAVQVGRLGAPMRPTGPFIPDVLESGPMAKVSVKDVTHGSGESGVFGEIFIGLGLLIGLAGVALWALTLTGFFDHSPVGAVAANNDALHLWFLLFIEGVGFTVFGIMCLVSGWDRQHHPDDVH